MGKASRPQRDAKKLFQPARRAETMLVSLAAATDSTVLRMGVERWRRARVVYRLDADVMRELFDTDLKVIPPPDALTHLPHDEFVVTFDPPFELYDSEDERTRRFEGVLVVGKRNESIAPITGRLLVGVAGATSPDATSIRGTYFGTFTDTGELQLTTATIPGQELRRIVTRRWTSCTTSRVSTRLRTRRPLSRARPSRARTPKFGTKVFGCSKAFASRSDSCCGNGRGARAHARLQNEFAAELARRGLVPLSPGPDDPQFDLAWLQPDGTLVVVEVKSLSDETEVHQLRIGLGQVIEYRWNLTARHSGQVRSVLHVEREPTDAEWAELCAEERIALTHPDNVASVLDSLGASLGAATRSLTARESQVIA